jgi:predicted phage tail protein
MVEVRLHGALAAEFGKVFHFDIKTPQEAVRAIEAGRPGFRKRIMDLDRKGMVFRVRTKTHDYGNDDVHMTLGAQKRIDIIPIIAGASAGVRFVIGAVLAVYGFMTGNVYAMSAGVSLMMGSVAEWLTPTPKKNDVKKLESWAVSGPTNTVDQGTPVPIIYGEVLAGGYTISAGISVSEVNAHGGTAAAATIGGNPNIVAMTGGAGTYTVVVMLSAGTFALGEPYTYAWGFTGFALAADRRLVVGDKATMRLELDYILNEGDVVQDTGDVTVDVTGKDLAGEVASTPATIMVSSAQAVSVQVTAAIYGGGS